MEIKKLSSRIYTLAKAGVAAAILPVFLIYIMIDKPDYKVMNAAAHIVVPAAGFVADGATWPIRIVGRAAANIRELSSLRGENAELRARLDAAQARSAECDILISENQKLAKELDMARDVPQKTIVAQVIHDNTAFHHSSFTISKGTESGIAPGMAVVSFQGFLVGIVSSAGQTFAKVRSLYDAKSNIPVRIAGSEIYGFLSGNGAAAPTIGFFNDPEFQNTKGLKLVSSGIRGTLPGGLPVGTTGKGSDVEVAPFSQSTEVMVLVFDDKTKYK
jgi:rod shape-determining protein MreC